MGYFKSSDISLDEEEFRVLANASPHISGSQASRTDSNLWEGGTPVSQTCQCEPESHTCGNGRCECVHTCRLTHKLVDVTFYGLCNANVSCPVCVCLGGLISEYKSFFS